MKVYSDSLHKIAYATDASAYREIPKGVAYPETVQDIQDLIALAQRKGTCLIPRAGGTSIAGQVVGDGIVVDVTRHFNRILEINARERWVRTQPGVIRDVLNAALKPYGLFFSPETSTTSRCCVGGMFGNNSCGTHSLIYGSTRDHVLEASAVLSDGSVEVFKEYTVAQLEERFGPRFWEGEPESLAGRLYAQLVRWAENPRTRQLVADNFPDRALRRRNCGYAIDEVLFDANASPRINLCKLLAGSEGTLAFITEIKLSLDPLPPTGKMVVCAHCDTLEKSYQANLVALRHRPAAVELIDGKILDLARANPGVSRLMSVVQGAPAALLVTELYGEDLDARAATLEADLQSQGLAYTCTRAYGAAVAQVWELRKAGLGVLNGMKGDARPVGVIEDTAVAPERLPAYLKDFGAILDEMGLGCVFYGHISTGELHLRPILNLKTADGRRQFREIAERTARLVRQHKGSLSGEHGDGRLRGEFIPLMYGDEVYQMMRALKHCWDPAGVFNLHKIIDTPPMDAFLRGNGVPLRADGTERTAVEEALASDKTYYNWRAVFDECTTPGVSGVRSQAHALLCSVEQCNGSGDCRKSNVSGGTICPAYRVSQDETRTTRARANVIREILTRGWESEVFRPLAPADRLFAAPELSEVLDTCLSCKGCLGECPSGVDMTRLKSELLQQKYDRHGMPLRSWAVSRMAAVERLGSLVAPVYNYFASAKWSSALLKKVLQFAPARSIPVLSRRTMRALVRKEQPVPGRKVWLFADEFTNYQEAELGLTFARLLRALGYEVEIPRHRESGRAAISKGNLRLARRLARANVELLADLVSEEVPLVGIEPSCILSFRDEYPDLVPPELRDRARELGRNSLLYDEFLAREIAAGRISPDSFRHVCEGQEAPDTVEKAETITPQPPLQIWLHGHCHQKALVGIEKTASVLRTLLPDAELHVIPSGCCGMAGSFGYEKEHYETSLAIGEMVLFPAVRQAVAQAETVAEAQTGSAQGPQAGPAAATSGAGMNPVGEGARYSGRQPGSVAVLAPGTSCRQQILDGTGVHALHPVVLLYNCLSC
ncbi:MAG: FAD-binding protein [Bacteroidales bacterium]|nr:FAD-binding protein [Bacteroidales bacterium]